MITVQEATHTILSNLPILAKEDCELENAHGRILRQEILADRDLPPFDRIMMDGIAINFEACKPNIGNPIKCQIEGHQAAGTPALTLSNKSNCIEVSTGATLPSGADTIIPVEEISIENDHAIIDPQASIRQWQYIHKQASDHPKGTALLSSGTFLNSKEIAAAASAGLSTLSVSCLPKIALISTGDELVSVQETPKPHQIRQSNAHMLAASINSQKLGKPFIYHIQDNQELLIKEIAPLLEEHDLLVFSGGVSKGKKDFLPQTLEKLGVVKKVHWVAQRPGKPLWFGISNDPKPIFGLPGNPLSTLTCYHRYINPALEKMALKSEGLQFQVKLADDFEFSPPLTCFLPVKLIQSSSETQAIPCPANNSGDYSGILETSGFVEIPQEVSVATKGSHYPFIPW